MMHRGDPFHCEYNNPVPFLSFVAEQKYCSFFAFPSLSLPRREMFCCLSSYPGDTLVGWTNLPPRLVTSSPFVHNFSFILFPPSDLFCLIGDSFKQQQGVCSLGWAESPLGQEACQLWPRWAAKPLLLFFLQHFPWLTLWMFVWFLSLWPCCEVLFQRFGSSIWRHRKWLSVRKKISDTLEKIIQEWLMNSWIQRLVKQKVWIFEQIHYFFSQ